MGKKTEKKPRTANELVRLENVANSMGGDYERAFKLFRYTGMHPSVIGTYDYKTGKDDFGKWHDSGCLIGEWPDEYHMGILDGVL